MTGLFLAAVGLDVHVHDTYFVVAHFHYIMVGGTVMAYMGGLHYWWPKMTGRMYPEAWARPSAFLIFFGFILTFLPQFLLGNAGMPRRYYAYPAQYQWLHVLSTGGAYLLAGALLLTLVNLAVAMKWGDPAPDNPWQSRSFEWLTRSPPITRNFARTPTLDYSPYDYTLTEEEARARAEADPG
jgi:cytochrome c oxidase subunit 1